MLLRPSRLLLLFAGVATWVSLRAQDCAPEEAGREPDEPQGDVCAMLQRKASSAAPRSLQAAQPQDLLQQRPAPGGARGHFETGGSAELPLPSWQHGLKEPGDGNEFDLVIVGAGIGGSYVVNKLRLEYNLDNITVAVAEREDDIGGRLLQSRDSNPPDAGPPIEYGGMRFDPFMHPKVAGMVEQVARLVYHLSPEQCNLTACRKGASACPDMIVPMMVSDVAYKLAGVKQNADGVKYQNEDLLPPLNIEAAKENLRSLQLALSTEASNEYLLDSGDPLPNSMLMRQGELHPRTWFRALSIPALVGRYFGNYARVRSMPFQDAVDEACQAARAWGSAEVEVEKWRVGLQNVCTQFRSPAEMVMSAIGYDDNTTEDSFGLVTGFLDEVVNMSGSINFYLFQRGYQQLARDILYSGGEAGVTPIYGKDLVKIFVCGRDEEYTKKLATKQAARFDMGTREIAPAAALDERERQCVNAPVKLVFADGSSALAKAVYLTPLPIDLVKIAGLQPWEASLQNTTTSSMGAKLGMGWSDFSLSSALNMTPCQPGPCQRLILDGDPPEWITRQVWLWTDTTVLIYGNAVSLPKGKNQPTQKMTSLYKDQGLGAVVARVMAQIRKAANMTAEAIPDPAWASFKAWPDGSLIPDWVDLTEVQATAYSELLSRPLGPHVPVFYGNSEMAPLDDHHTWVEGAFDAADQVLGEMSEMLASEAGKSIAGGWYQATM